MDLDDLHTAVSLGLLLLLLFELLPFGACRVDEVGVVELIRAVDVLADVTLQLGGVRFVSGYRVELEDATVNRFGLLLLLSHRGRC